jgi:hypothetical protein
MEHRWGERYTLDHPIRIRTQGGLLASGDLVDVSVSGAFIATPLPAALYSHVQILLYNSQHDRRPSWTLDAQVVRKSRRGVGVEWQELAPEIIRTLIATQLRGEAARMPSVKVPYTTRGR